MEVLPSREGGVFAVKLPAAHERHIRQPLLLALELVVGVRVTRLISVPARAVLPDYLRAAV